MTLTRSLALLQLVTTLALVGCSAETQELADASAAADSLAEAAPVAAQTADPDTIGSASPAVVFEEHEIADPARGGMTAYRFLVPQGWTVEGGVLAVPPAYGMLPYLADVTMRAPDGRGARFMGMLEFGYADGVNLPPFTPYQGRPFLPIPESLGEHWVRMFELNPAEGVTNLEIVSETLLEQATERVRKLLAGIYESTRRENQTLRMSGESVEFDVEARRLVIRYDEGGRRIEATIFTSFRRTIYRYPNGAVRAAMWNLDDLYAVFGPIDTNPLEDPVIAAVVRARTTDPAWQEAVQRWYLLKNQQIVVEGNARIAAAARAAATVRTTQSQSVLDISFAGWKSRNAASDAGHASSIDGIHERTAYASPSGSTVHLPSHYQHVYTDGQGQYVLHQDANWEINTDPLFRDRDWQRVEPQR